MKTGLLGIRSIRAVLWSGLDIIVRQGLTFAITIALARLLTPQDYGTIALLYLFSGIAGVFVEGGFSAALIQRQDVTHVDESTAFWINISTGAVAALLLWAAAPAIAGFYERPELVPLTAALAINLFISAFSSVHFALLTKRLDFRTQLHVGAIATACAGGVALAAAWSGYGPWALAAQILVGSAMTAMLLWALHPWRPAFVFSLPSARRLFSFSAYILLSNLLDVIYARAYTVLIGKFYSVTALGLYSRAENTKQMPAGVLGGILSRVAMPFFSQVASDKVRLQGGMRRAIQGIMLINVPMMVGLAVTAEPTLVVLFGSQWAPAAPILQILALGGVLWPLHVINLNALIAQGHSHLFFRLEVAKKIVGTILIVAGSMFGLLGIAWSQVVFAIAAFLINAYFTASLLDYGALKQLRDLMSLFAVAAVMAIVLLVIKAHVIMTPVMLLVTLVGVGASVFVTMAVTLHIGPFVEASQALRTFLRNRSVPSREI